MVAMAKSDLAAAEWDAIYLRAQAGESVKVIARDLGRDASAVYRILERRYGYRAHLWRRALWTPT